MAALQIQESSGNKGGSGVVVTSKGRSLLGTGSGVVPASPTDEPILVRGNLQKLGKRFKGWHQRYFEIQGSHMYYYKNASKKECLGEINLTICFSCEPTTAATFGSPFEIKTVQRSHVLAARSKEEMQQWIQVIKERMSPSESEAKKGNNKTDTAKKSTKPKRWESFKGAFTIKQRSQSPAPLDTQERKKAAKKTFMDRFKVKRGGANQRTLKPEENKRPLSFTGADEKNKDTLDVFAQFEVSKSLPSSPVAKRKKLPSRESPPPISPMSMSSGSPFTGGATTEDSQRSTPSHTAAVISNQDARTQQQVAPTVVGQEIQVRVDIEDTTPSPIPTIIEPSETVEAGETSETTTTTTTAAEDTSKPEIIIEQEPESTAESPAKQVEPVDTVQKDIESPTEPAEPVEPAASVVQEEIKSSTKPAEPEDSNKTEAEEDKSPIETAESAVNVPKEPENPTKPVEAAVVVEKEPEKPALPAKPAVILEEKAAERKNEKPALPTKPAVVIEDVEKSANKPALPVKPSAVKEKDAEKTSDKPSLPVKPASAKAKETESKSVKPVLPAKPAIVTEKESEPVSPSKRIVIAEPAKVEKVEEPSVPKYLKDRKFQWDKIREVLETAPESTENSSYSELPPQNATWMEHSSPVEQLRAFLMVCP